VFALSLDSCHVPPISCWSLQQSLLFPITTVVIIDPVPKLTNFAKLVRFKKNQLCASESESGLVLHENTI
jgi:hypothetical protein